MPSLEKLEEDGEATSISIFTNPYNFQFLPHLKIYATSLIFSHPFKIIYLLDLAPCGRAPIYCLDLISFDTPPQSGAREQVGDTKKQSEAVWEERGKERHSAKEVLMSRFCGNQN